MLEILGHAETRRTRSWASASSAARR